MALTLLATNNAESTLASAISATDTSLIVSAGTGAEFPDAVAGESYFKLTITDAATGAQVEIVNVTARSGDIFTIERGAEGTTPRDWLANDLVANMMTAETINIVAESAQQATIAASQASESADIAESAADNAVTTLLSAIKQTITFQSGGELNSKLDRISDGTYLYYWTGLFPKVVPPESTVEGTGGEITGAWACDTSLPFRQNLGSSEEGLGISLTALEQGGNGQNLAVFVSPQMRHADPHAHFGTAMMAAFSTAMTMGIGEVRVPAGVYVLDSTIAVTLSMSMTLTFDPGVIIYVDSPLSVFNFNINGKHLSIEGNNARVLSRWGSLSNTGSVAFKFTDATLDKSLTVSNLKVGTADSTSKFQYSVYGTGLNLTTFTDCVLQSTYGIYLESVLLNGTLYHAMGNCIDGCKIYTDDYCIKIGNQGALGCEGFIVNGGELVCDTTAIIIDNIGLTSSAYLPPLFRIESVHISAYRALYAKDISRLFFSGDVQVKSNPSITGTYNGVIEVGGVQQFHHGRVSYSSVPLNGATGADMIPVIYQFASTLSNAFFTSNGNIYQLDAMTAPVFAFSGTANVTEIQVSNDRLTSSGSWVSSTYLAYVRLPPEMTIGNLGASAGLDYSTKGAFSSGVLSLGTRPSQGFTYSIPTSILPNGSAISQITFPSQMVGKEVNILLAAANVSFTHGTNMVCPDQKSFVMTLPNAIKVFALNTTQCIILDVGGMANRHTDITSIPTSRTSPGYPGAEIFDSANMILYRYISGYGWGKVTVTAIS